MAMSQAKLWLIIGFAGQALFTARFLVQWIASERKRDSVVPVAFWWLSLLGGLMLLDNTRQEATTLFATLESEGEAPWQGVLTIPPWRLVPQGLSFRGVGANGTPIFDGSQTLRVTCPHVTSKPIGSSRSSGSSSVSR